MGRYIWISIALNIGPICFYLLSLLDGTICLDLLSLEDLADMYLFIEP